MSESISVIHVVPSLHARTGGLSRTVLDLARSLGDVPDTRAVVLSQRHAMEQLPDWGASATSFVITSADGAAQFLAFPLRSALYGIPGSSANTLIHSHGIWSMANHWASRAGRRFSLPTVIHPHGMLEPWALRQKATKKQIALALYQRADLMSAKLFVATSAMEYQSIRAFGLRQPVAIIPNGISVASNSSYDRHSEYLPPRNHKSVLFLSRIHPKKGLFNLLKAWSMIDTAGWRLKIAGGDDGGHLCEVVTEAKKLGVDATVDFLGELDDAGKHREFSAADLFVLPTFSENFGLVVAEALANGLPVITTRGAPWSDLERHGCGWWIEIGVDYLAQALRVAMSLDDQTRRQMGRRGRDYASRFDWNRVARQMSDVYRWLAGKGDCPPTVEHY